MFSYFYKNLKCFNFLAEIRQIRKIQLKYIGNFKNLILEGHAG